MITSAKSEFKARQKGSRRRLKTMTYGMQDLAMSAQYLGTKQQQARGFSFGYLKCHDRAWVPIISGIFSCAHVYQCKTHCSTLLIQLFALSSACGLGRVKC